MGRLIKIALGAAVCLTLTGCMLYRHFVTDQIKDGGGGMTNPNAVTDDGKELVKFSWQQAHTDLGRCFALDFYIDDEVPLMRGSFQSRSSDDILQIGTDASLRAIPCSLTWVQWFDLQRELAATELPEYHHASSEASDEADSRIVIVWLCDGVEKTLTLDGSNAESLESYVLNLAQELYDASQPKE